MASAPIFIDPFRVETAVLIAAHSTTVPIRGWTAGASGSRIHAIGVAATDAGANTMILYHGEAMTLVANMGTGAFLNNGGSPDTITRTTGSFITDGWLVGDRFYVHGPTTLLNGFFVTLTVVAALILTFVTGSTNTAENFPSGAIIYRLSQLHLTTLAANAGNAASTDALDLIITDWPMADVTPDRYITLGATDALVFSVGTAVGASPDRIDITVFGGDY